MLSFKPFNHNSSFEDIKIRSEYTGTGHDSFSPWNAEIEKYTIGQLYRGSKALGNIEIIDMLTIQNQASQMYAWSDVNRTMKYNPKVYLSVQESVGTRWLYHYENGEHLSLPTWPESCENYNYSLQ